MTCLRSYYQEFLQQHSCVEHLDLSRDDVSKICLVGNLCSSLFSDSQVVKTTGYYDACHVSIDDRGHNHTLEDQRRGCIRSWGCVVADCNNFSRRIMGPVKLRLLVCLQESEIATIDVEAHSPGILGKILVGFSTFKLLPEYKSINPLFSCQTELPTSRLNKLSHWSPKMCLNSQSCSAYQPQYYLHFMLFLLRVIS